MIMTKENIKKAAEVMLAYTQGKDIQRQDSNGKWIDCSIPMFDWASYNYRIKPQLIDIQPNQWISIDENLPKQDEEVIVLCDELNVAPNYKISFGHIVDKTICKDYNRWNIPNVVYWFPMPKLSNK